jgi:hypothetical protein
VVGGLSYGLERPLYPADPEAADRTHAFDSYCRPFTPRMTDLPRAVWNKVRLDAQPYEIDACAFLAVLFAAGLALRVFDRRGAVEAWLEQPQAAVAAPAWYNVSLPAPVLGAAALAVLIGVSIVGCFTYYPPAQESLDQISNASTEALSAAMTGDRKHAEHWIPIYADWLRKLQVGVYLRKSHLSEFHRMKAHIIDERLEMLEHELAHGDVDEVRGLVAAITRAQRRLRTSYTEDL